MTSRLAWLLVLAACQAPPSAPPKLLALPRLGIRLAAPPDARIEKAGGPDAVVLRSKSVPD